MEHEPELREFVISSARELGLTIGESHAEQFMRYLAHLIEWNKVINLTAIIDPKEIIIKHFVDSLVALVATSFPKNNMVLDVGSGGGFPGIPLKIVRSDLRLTLVEPVQKKCSFLNSVIGLLKLHDVSTFDGTIEQYAKRPISRVIDTVVVRALKFEKVKKHLSALLTSKGKVVLYRTSAIEKQEMGEEFHLMSETALMLPQGSGKRVVTVIERNNS
ncbi:MAG TPA: 16S rRNA (guanine(527)-N(7))-methyltransferase RsmG [Nitrospiraceae bacterium]|nr:16S rRNA (guanine(527)-N(7))-methyltransferase RsmG [Nitrospiraceae bacterium]